MIEIEYCLYLVIRTNEKYIKS